MFFVKCCIFIIVDPCLHWVSCVCRRIILSIEKNQGGDLGQALAFFFEQGAPPPTDGGISGNSAADTTDDGLKPHDEETHKDVLPAVGALLDEDGGLSHSSSSVQPPSSSSSSEQVAQSVQVKAQSIAKSGEREKQHRLMLEKNDTS